MILAEKITSKKAGVIMDMALFGSQNGVPLKIGQTQMGLMQV